MPQFTYKATNRAGEKLEGVLEAETQQLAGKALREQGLIPITVSGGKAKRKLNVSFSFGNIKLSEKIVFTKNMAGMLEAGLALSRALQVIQKQTKNPAFKKIIDSLIAEIDKGGTFSGGMEKHPKAFSTLFVSMVRAGEESGSLPSSLREVGMVLEKTFELNRKVKGAMMYPSVIVGAIALVGILMMIYVVPTLTKTFTELGIDLPLSTRIIIFMSDTIKNYIAFIILGFGLFVVGTITLFKKSAKARRAKDRAVLMIPVVGTIVKEVNTARTARTLASLLTSGVSMTKAIEITLAVIQNSRYKAVLQKARDSVEKGVALSVIFKAETKLYPVMMGEMMEVGEETGKFSTMLMDIAKYYESEVDNKTKNLSTIIEPVLMVFIGGAVGFFAISMLTPMYSILDTIG